MKVEAVLDLSDNTFGNERKELSVRALIDVNEKNWDWLWSNAIQRMTKAMREEVVKHAAGD